MKEGHLDWSHVAYELPSKHAVKGKIEGKIKGEEDEEKHISQLLDCLKEMRRCWNLKEEALDHTSEEAIAGLCNQ